MNDTLNMYLMALSAIPQLRAEIDIKIAQLNVIEKDNDFVDTYSRLHSLKPVTESADDRKKRMHQCIADIGELEEQIDGMYKIMDRYYDRIPKRD